VAHVYAVNVLAGVLAAQVWVFVNGGRLLGHNPAFLDHPRSSSTFSGLLAGFGAGIGTGSNTKQEGEQYSNLSHVFIPFLLLL
jgi:hypothetical protein